MKDFICCLHLFQVGIIWSEVACVVLCIIVGFYHLWFGGGKRKEAADWGNFNKIRRISQVSLPLSLNSFPPYQEPRYINVHVMDKESLTAAFCRFLSLMGLI